MQIGHKTARTVTQHVTLLLRNSWRFALMGTLFALTCWEVNPGGMPMPEDDSTRPAGSVAVAAIQADRSE